LLRISSDLEKQEHLAWVLLESRALLASQQRASASRVSSFPSPRVETARLSTLRDATLLYLWTRREKGYRARCLRSLVPFSIANIADVRADTGGSKTPPSLACPSTFMSPESRTPELIPPPPSSGRLVANSNTIVEPNRDEPCICFCFSSILCEPCWSVSSLPAGCACSSRIASTSSSPSPGATPLAARGVVRCDCLRSCKCICVCITSPTIPCREFADACHGSPGHF